MAPKKTADMKKLQKKMEEVREALSAKMVEAAKKEDFATVYRISEIMVTLGKVTEGKVSSRAEAKGTVERAMSQLKAAARAFGAIDSLRDSPTFRGLLSSLEDHARMFLFDLSKANTILQETDSGEVIEVSVGLVSDVAAHALNALDTLLDGDYF